MKIGERLIERKIECNKIIRISEFKEFEEDFESICDDIKDYIDDDYEFLYEWGICWSWEDLYSIDCELCRDMLEEWIETQIEIGQDEEDFNLWHEHIKTLKKGENYIIYFNAIEDVYTKNYIANFKKNK